MPTEQNPSLLSAYRVLDYALTKAAVSAQLTNTTLRIPYKELVASVGKETTKEIDLVLTISMAWDETIEATDDHLNVKEE
ncbi:MAG: hypothetical protein ACAH17_03520 [Candidatus Paceibacterota bacterium]